MTADKLKKTVQDHFSRIRQAVDLREMLLLRQIDVLMSQYTNHKLSQKIQIDEVNFYSKNETEILNLLRLYGKFNIQSLNISDICEEEYEDDQMNIMHSKPFQKDETIRCNVLDNKKIIKDKCNLLNESIINMTLNESKELIQKSTGLVASVGDKLKKELNIVENDNKKQKQELQQQNRADGIGSQGKPVKSNQSKQVTKGTSEEKSASKLKRNDATTSSTKKTLKNISNLTLNLKNITSLTINCKDSCKVEKVEPPLPTTSKKASSPEVILPECKFYERLISENKILQNIQKPCPAVKSPTAPKAIPDAELEHDDGTYSINSTPEDTVSSFTDDAEDGFLAQPKKIKPSMDHFEVKEIEVKEIKDSLRNVENVEEISTRNLFAEKSPMNFSAGGSPGNNNFGFCFMEFEQPPHPHLQHWLRHIMVEPETEPLQNASEFLEFSKIH